MVPGFFAGYYTVPKNHAIINFYVLGAPPLLRKALGFAGTP
jgi:hypothetical protein